LLRKDERIKTASEIKGIIKRRNILLNSPTLQITIEHTQRKSNRILVICPNKVAGAVDRNRMRRAIISETKEISRNKAEKYDFVFKVIQAAPSDVIREEAGRLMAGLQ
jgi:ribonuclease P protein component